MKNNIGKIIIFVLGVISGTCISVYAAYNYYAKDISFTPKNENWQVDNIEDAINDLYSSQNMEYKKSIETLNVPGTNSLTYDFEPNFIIARCDTIPYVIWKSYMGWYDGEYSFALEKGADSNPKNGSITVDGKNVNIEVAGYVEGSGTIDCMVYAAKL